MRLLYCCCTILKLCSFHSWISWILVVEKLVFCCVLNLRRSLIAKIAVFLFKISCHSRSIAVGPNTFLSSSYITLCYWNCHWNRKLNKFTSVFNGALMKSATEWSSRRDFNYVASHFEETYCSLSGYWRIFSVRCGYMNGHFFVNHLNSIYLITVFSSSNDNLKDRSTLYFIRVFFQGQYCLSNLWKNGSQLIFWGGEILTQLKWIKFVTCSSLVTNGFLRHTSKFTQTPLRKIRMTSLHRFFGAFKHLPTLLVGLLVLRVYFRRRYSIPVCFLQRKCKNLTFRGPCIEK